MAIPRQAIAADGLGLRHRSRPRRLAGSDVKRLQGTDGLPAVMERRQWAEWGGRRRKHAVKFCASAGVCLESRLFTAQAASCAKGRAACGSTHRMQSPARLAARLGKSSTIGRCPSP